MEFFEDYQIHIDLLQHFFLVKYYNWKDYFNQYFQYPCFQKDHQQILLRKELKRKYALLNHYHYRKLFYLKIKLLKELKEYFKIKIKESDWVDCDY